MDFVSKHLSKGRDLVALVDPSHVVPFPSAETLDKHATWSTEWLKDAVKHDLPDSQDARDIVESLVSLCAFMNHQRIIYEENAYDIAHEELWNALYDAHAHFNPDGAIGDWEYVFDDFPKDGFAKIPEHLQVDYNCRAVLLQKEMAFEKLLKFLREKGHADLVNQFGSQLASEVEAGTFPKKPVGFLENPSHLT